MCYTKIMKQCLECNKLLDKPTDKHRSKCNSCRSAKYSDKINAKKRNNYDPLKKQVYYQNNKVAIKARTSKTHIERRKIDPLYKLINQVRTRTNQTLKSKKLNKISNFAKYIGCTPEELKLHIEKQFQPGMSWELHSKDGFHIDHIIPLSSAKNEKEVYTLCHYTNLQPLWAIDNMKKGSKVS